MTRKCLSNPRGKSRFLSQSNKHNSISNDIQIHNHDILAKDDIQKAGSISVSISKIKNRNEPIKYSL